MRIIGIVAFLGAIFFISSARAQCHQYVFGVPVCTGFCLDNDSSSSKNWMDLFGDKIDSVHREATRMYDSLMMAKMHSVRKIADSVVKEAQKLKDSLNLEGGGNLGDLVPRLKDIYHSADSVLKNWNW